MGPGYQVPGLERALYRGQAKLARRATRPQYPFKRVLAGWYRRAMRRRGTVRGRADWRANVVGPQPCS